MASPRQQQDSSDLNEYKERLQSEWTHMVACQDECQPPESCTCQRKIIHVEALKAWLKRKASQTTNQTTLHRLFEEVQRAKHRNFPLDFATYFEGDYGCIRVFSRLLEQGCGHLIDLFYKSNVHDHSLERGEEYTELRENLIAHMSPTDADTIITQFKSTRWAYCPLALKLHVERGLTGTGVILPFCRKMKLPAKGGTASVYWVAVQKDLISDEPLRVALRDSQYKDPKFGECYQMALKTYIGKRKPAFEYEQEAFSGLKGNHDVPIVRYLGSYKHDHGEGKTSDGTHLGKTYNLLLEYGEGDLMQYWADETNVPPVLADEIIREWKLLFEVAKAIRQVHNLEISRERGESWKFYGWHADVKPDNILIVHGRFKLADFGFSKFAPVEQAHGEAPLLSVLPGFTETYGAPEISMKRPDGTLSGVTQSIDTWSFGCVLSVAATWIVLGYQGVLQYEKLRQQSPSNNKGKKIFDRFHDGREVLPIIKKWHNYLRGHLRMSDTTTSLVLDLIEGKMLQSDPTDRYSLEELCEELQELVCRATERVKKLKPYSRTTDETVKQALLTMEQNAHEQRSLNLKSTPLGRDGSHIDTASFDESKLTPTVPAPKGQVVKSKQLGVTMARKALLEGTRQRESFNDTKGLKLEDGRHMGAMTGSPVDEHTPREWSSDSSDRQERPRNPDYVETNARRSAHSTDHRGNSREHKETKSTLPSSQITHYATSGETSRSGELPSVSSPDSRKPRDPRRHGQHAPHSGQNVSITTPSSSYKPNGPPIIAYEEELSNPLPAPARLFHNFIAIPKQPMENSYGIGVQQSFDGSPKSSPGTPVRDVLSPTGLNIFDKTQGTTMSSQNHSPESKFSPDRLLNTLQSFPGPVNENTHFESNSGYTSPVTNPTIQITQAGDGSPHSMVPGVWRSPNVSDKEAINADESLNPVANQALPDTVYDLPYDICGRRRFLDQEIPQGLGSKLKGKMGMETREVDVTLAETFSKRREIILVVDNGATMFEHWPILTFVADTLAKNAAGLDKDGIDIVFTVDGHEHNRRRLKGKSGRQMISHLLNAAWPRNTSNDESLTDMNQVLSDLVQKWKSAGRKATTLLVLTDGIWSKTDLRSLNETILNVARMETKHAGQRHFTIQFIRFGESRYEQLQWLDDKLCEAQNLSDIIDHCSWRASVVKMFKGSIENWHDQKNSNEPPIHYDYQELVEFFHNFNKSTWNKDYGSLSVNGKGISRSSSHSSTHDARRKHNSTPPARTGSWHITQPDQRKTYHGHDFDKGFLG